MPIGTKILYNYIAATKQFNQSKRIIWRDIIPDIVWCIWCPLPINLCVFYCEILF